MQKWFSLILYTPHLLLQDQQLNTTHLFSLLVVIDWAVCSHSLNSEYLLEVYPRSFPCLFWPLVLSTFSSSSLYCQLPLVLFTIFFFLKSCFFFFFLWLFSPPPPVVLAFSFGRWSFYFQLFLWRFAAPRACFNALSTSCFWITRFANKSGTIVFKLMTHSTYSVWSGSSTICPS